MKNTILNFLNRTVLNSNDNNSLVKFSVGDVINDKYKVIDKLSVSSSGEADLYKVVSLSNNRSSTAKLKNT
jgi:hypothetical protein